MVDKKKAEEAAAAEHESSYKEGSGYTAAEELREKLDTPLAEFEGTKAMNGWKPGKQLKEEEYIKAVQEFNNATAGRR